jgi:hypothetical protein
MIRRPGCMIRRPRDVAHDVTEIGQNPSTYRPDNTVCFSILYFLPGLADDLQLPEA